MLGVLATRASLEKKTYKKTFMTLSYTKTY